MRHLASIHDPIHRLIIKLLIDCLTALYVTDKYHWVNNNGGNGRLTETNPKFKLKW